MKLASLPGGRDGRLAVVSRDLARTTLAEHIAGTLQEALDDWVRCKPALGQLASKLEAGQASTVPFDAATVLSPLPRAHHWVDGSAYVNHVELVRQGARRHDARIFLDGSARLPGRLGRLPATAG
jgi:fumarylacetoacetate (FAA) hydrolase